VVSILTGASYGVILNFKRGPKTQKNDECLLRIPNVENDRFASRYIGRKVIWVTEKGKKIVGQVVDVHGKEGVVRARFRRGLPGQALGTKVSIL
jgi:large subunit ribosomal protein L35Ae